ncbi:YegP family protein [Methylocystis sp. S23]
MFYYVYVDAAFQWRWTLYAANHKKIANSGEGYVNKADCLHAIALVKSSASAPIHYQS